MPAIKTTDDALKALGICDKNLYQKQLIELDQKGFTTFYYPPEVWKEKGIDLDFLARKIDELLTLEGCDAGKESNQYITSGPERGRKARKGERVEPNADRLCNLINKDPSFVRLAMLPEILVCSSHIISDEMRLSSLDMREPLKNCGNQELHVDVPDFTGGIEASNVQCVSFLYIDDSTDTSGPLRVIPGTHKTPFNKKNFDDLIKHYEEEKLITVPRGTLVIANASLWHSGTNKLDDSRRRVLFINYRHRKLRPQLNQKAFIARHKIKSMTEAEKYLLGVSAGEQTDRLRFWAYYNRNVWYIKFLIKVKSNFRKFV